MPSPTGAFIIVCVLWAILGLVFAKIVYDVHRAMTDARTDEQKQRAREHYRTTKGEPLPTDQPDKKPPPKRYFGEQ